MRKAAPRFAGWDIGGAHLKLAVADARGRLIHVGQYFCPLWRGLDELDLQLSRLQNRFHLREALHAVTMTGDLADIFADRREGVQALLHVAGRRIGAKRLKVYSLRHGLCNIRTAFRVPIEVASANWHATAASVAEITPEALLVDIGSTTTDIIPVRDGRVAARGSTDAGRLRTGELLYTGVSRTPIMAVAQRVKFHGVWQNMTAEHFANMADVYQLIGDLRFGAGETADGRGKKPRDCARRLARMLGCDLRDAPMRDWRQTARFIAGVQQENVLGEMKRVLSAFPRSSGWPVIGAGAGRFIARRLAKRLRRRYVDYAELVNAPRRWREPAAVCAPAVALTLMGCASC